MDVHKNNNDEDSLQEAYKEMYNVEQNEILQMNIESTIKRQKNLQEVDCHEHAIENKDMSADPIHIPVYKPIPYDKHKVMFTNSQLQDKDQTYKNIRPKDIDAGSQVTVQLSATHTPQVESLKRIQPV